MLFIVLTAAIVFLSGTSTPAVADDGAPCSTLAGDCCDEGVVSVGCDVIVVVTPDGEIPNTEGDPETGGDGPVTKPANDEPRVVCTQTEHTNDRLGLQGYLGEDGSIWSPRTYTCQPGDISYTIPVCVGNCPEGAEEEPEPPAPGAVVSPIFLRQQLFAQVLPLPPTVVIAPDQPVVGVPTFFQVDTFETRSATDTEGGLTVAVTATPREVRWTAGEHAWACSSAGAGYTEERLERAMDASGIVDDGDICTWLFTHATHDDGPSAGAVSTVWDYSWSINGADQGVFNAGVSSPTTDFDLDIIEIQSVLTNG